MSDKKTIQEALAEVQRKVNEERAARAAAEWEAVQEGIISDVVSGAAKYVKPIVKGIKSGATAVKDAASSAYDYAKGAKAGIKGGQEATTAVAQGSKATQAGAEAAIAAKDASKVAVEKGVQLAKDNPGKLAAGALATGAAGGIAIDRSINGRDSSPSTSTPAAAAPAASEPAPAAASKPAFEFGSKKGGMVTADELNKWRAHVGNSQASLGQYMNARDNLKAVSGQANDPSVIQNKLDAISGGRTRAYDPNAPVAAPAAASQPSPEPTPAPATQKSDNPNMTPSGADFSAGNFEDGGKKKGKVKVAESTSPFIQAFLKLHEAANLNAPVKNVQTGGGAYPVYKKSSVPAQSFENTFGAAKKAGAGTFDWQGRKYATGQKGGHYNENPVTTNPMSQDPAQRAQAQRDAAAPSTIPQSAPGVEPGSGVVDVSNAVPPQSAPSTPHVSGPNAGSKDDRVGGSTGSGQDSREAKGAIGAYAPGSQVSGVGVNFNQTDPGQKTLVDRTKDYFGNPSNYMFNPQGSTGYMGAEPQRAGERPASAAPAPAATTPAPATTAPGAKQNNTLETRSGMDFSAGNFEDGGKKKGKVKVSESSNPFIAAFLKLQESKPENMFEAAKRLSPKQEKLAALAGDKSKIDAADLKAVRAKGSLEEDGDDAVVGKGTITYKDPKSGKTKDYMDPVTKNNPFMQTSPDKAKMPNPVPLPPTRSTKPSNMASDATIEKIKKDLAKEEFEQLDEIGDTPAGKRMLGRYIRKASGDKSASDFLAGYNSKGANSFDNINTSAGKEYQNNQKSWERKSDKRRSGIENAVKRLVKNEEFEAVLDLLESDTLSLEEIAYIEEKYMSEEHPANLRIQASMAAKKYGPSHPKAVAAAKRAKEVKEDVLDEEHPANLRIQASMAARKYGPQHPKAIAAKKRADDAKGLQNEEVNEETNLRLIKKHASADGSKVAKVYKDHEWGEYRVRHFQDGKHLDKADYHTDDKDDAHGTAKSFIKENAQLDELSSKTLLDYHTKALADTVTGKKDRSKGMKLAKDKLTGTAAVGTNEEALDELAPDSWANSPQKRKATVARNLKVSPGKTVKEDLFSEEELAHLASIAEDSYPVNQQGTTKLGKNASGNAGDAVTDKSDTVPNRDLTDEKIIKVKK